jgi:hypothetical protein
MSQLHVEVYKQGTPSPFVCSVSYFESDPATPRYRHYLRSFLRDSRALVGAEVRVYTDQSGLAVASEEAEPYPHVTILTFDCPPFREGVGHAGTFGTIVRFLPLFEPHSLVWISDLDVPTRMITMDVVRAMGRADVWIDTIVCYDTKPQSMGRPYPIVAWRFLCRPVLPKQLLTRFLHRVEAGHPMRDALVEWYTPRQRNVDPRFPYGMDEVWLNETVYAALQRRSCVAKVHTMYDVGSFLRGRPAEERQLFRAFFHAPTEARFRRVKEILREVLPTLAAERPCLQTVLDRLDSLPMTMDEVQRVRL